MNAEQIYSKTKPFVWAKLLLGLATVAVAAVLFAILMGLGWLFNSGSVIGIMFIIWLAAVGVVRFIVMHYFGYLVKAGHVAVIAEAVSTGNIPDNQVAYGKKMVTERFATSNIYFAVDNLVSGAVKQIQGTVQSVGNALDFIPGMDAVTGLAKYFINISLGYIDECCLGYTFYKKDDSAFKSAADGVVIYAQNWKKLLKDAAKTMAIVIVAMVIIVVVCFIALGVLFRVMHWNGLVAFILSVLIAMTIKFAFIDSYIMVKMMTSYMEAVPETQISFDLYNSLCGISGKFKELFEKGQKEQPSYASAGSTDTAFKAVEEVPKYIFCAECGAKNETDSKFCAECGAKIN